MTTETWILVVWTVGLVGALPPTILIVKEVRLLLGTLSSIRRLADRTATAARGIAAHVEPVPRLPEAFGHTERLLAASGRVSAACSALADEMDAKLGASRLERLGQWILQWFAGRRS